MVVDCYLSAVSRPNLIMLLHDAAWLQYMGALAPFLFLMATIAVASFIDKRENRIFPRWVGDVNLWFLVLFLPNQLMFFFYTGPFAWNGLFGFWIPVIDFFIWFSVIFVVLRKAISNEAAGAI